jgi:prepilin-type N-terminal cleavage/methylation domain-containing protein
MLAKNSGFTLIEITLVVSISALLIVIAFLGQRQLLEQARFDGAMDKVMQEISYARNYALTNVNQIGSGNIPGTLVAGATIEFEGPSFYRTEIETIYGKSDSVGNLDMTTLSDWPSGLPNPTPQCPPAQHPEGANECLEMFQNLGVSLQLTGGAGLIYFINTGHGLKVCHEIGAATTIPHACSLPPTGPFPLVIKDASGHQSKIMVDDVSGFASRSD